MTGHTTLFSSKFFHSMTMSTTVFWVDTPEDGHDMKPEIFETTYTMHYHNPEDTTHNQ